MTIGIGVVGMGFMGRTHVTAYLDAIADGADARLVAVSDHDAERRAGRGTAGGNLDVAGEGPLFDVDDVRGFARPAELFADDGIGVVSICTPTESHVELAIEALRAGKHVLLEKPVALRARDVATLAEAAERAHAQHGLVCMPAMCMRFWPGWDTLRAAVQDQRYGALRSLAFRRRGSRPTWNAFYDDEARSGGALFDLHVHDVDLVVWCLGMPTSVFAAGDRAHVTASYRFARGQPVHVTAEGGWDHAPGTPFEMTFTAVFADATLLYDGSGPHLRVCRNGEADDLPLGPVTGYRRQIDHLLARVATPVEAESPTVVDAFSVTRLLEAEARSLELGHSVDL